MGKFFSDVVEQALRDIYYDMASGHGQESFRRLEEASEAGDGDASALLARCLCGYQYTWSGHGFPEDDHRAVKLMHQSVDQGSAIGVLLSLRSGELAPWREKKMPFSSLQEAFDIVLAKAEGGDAFCQYTIGNVYFWWDFLRIEGKNKESFPNEEAFRSYMKNSIAKCEGWFLKAYEGGMYHAGNNLNNYYHKGDEDLIPPMPWKSQGLWKKGLKRAIRPISICTPRSWMLPGRRRRLWSCTRRLRTRERWTAGSMWGWLTSGVMWFPRTTATRPPATRKDFPEVPLAATTVWAPCTLTATAYPRTMRRVSR